MLLSKIRYLILFLVVTLQVSAFAQWQVSGGLYTPFVFQPASSSGLSGVYILYGMRQATLTFEASNTGTLQCYRYSVSALNPEPIASRQEGKRVYIDNPQAGYGYFVEQAGTPLSYIWLIDYAPMAMQSLQVDESASDCDQTRLIFERTAPEIQFNGINGRTEQIAREFTLSYQTLRWNDESKQYDEITVNESVRGYRELMVDAPLCNTTFSITGDQFQQFWGIASTLTSSLYEAIAVAGEAFAEQSVREGGNELDKENDELGGSAPVDITFTGYSNQPIATYQAWEIARDAEFNLIDATYNGHELKYAFEEEGTTYVRFVVSNATGSCEKVVQTFTINTSESSLKVPNVFTPDSGSGNNQIFKVAYKSILKFDARVFNRWGNQLFHWTNPAEGWDGKVNGKVVPTGAYYYIIEAEGVGGKKYKLKGDINVLRTRN